jgi:hypothetical protein
VHTAADVIAREPYSDTDSQGRGSRQAIADPYGPRFPIALRCSSGGEAEIRRAAAVQASSRPGAHDAGDVHVACLLVLVARINAEDLRKILDVDLRAVGQPVKALDRERLSFKVVYAFGQVLDGAYIDKQRYRC